MQRQQPQHHSVPEGASRRLEGSSDGDHGGKRVSIKEELERMIFLMKNAWARELFGRRSKWPFLLSSESDGSKFLGKKSIMACKSLKTARRLRE